MKTGRYAAIILAAGFSSRMGALKPLLPLGDETVADHVIATFLDSGADVFLVVGWRRDEITTGIKNREITIVENPDYEQGMFTSIQAGVRKLAPRHGAFFVMPVDIPLVRPATVARLMAESARHPGKIIYPVFGAARGHPPLLPACLATAITHWPGGGGLKALLEAHEGTALNVAVPDGNILFNLNKLEDYQALLERFRRYDIPTDEECGVILNDIAGTPPEVQRHGMKVAEVALKIGRALELAGERLDLEAIRMAALLHDVVKGQPRHDSAGGELLRGLGFGPIGDIVAVHTDLLEGEAEASLAAKVVYLADKLVAGERLVSLEERYRSSRERFSPTPEIEEKILRRKKRAIQVS